MVRIKLSIYDLLTVMLTGYSLVNTSLLIYRQINETFISTDTIYSTMLVNIITIGCLIGSLLIHRMEKRRK